MKDRKTMSMYEKKSVCVCAFDRDLSRKRWPKITNVRGLRPTFVSLVMNIIKAIRKIIVMGILRFTNIEDYEGY